MSPTPEERVAESFNLYFANWDIGVAPEDVAVGSRRTIVDRKSGWRITYRVDDDGGGMPNLEFYATNRWTNDRHVQIWADGHGEHLEAVSEIFFHEPEEPDSGTEEIRTRNEAVVRELRDRGLY
jgi:hypothetical protein